MCFLQQRREFGRGQQVALNKYISIALLIKDVHTLRKTHRSASFFVVISVSFYFWESFSSYIVFRGQKNLQDAQGRESSSKNQKTSLKTSVTLKKKNKSSKYSSSV